jgi:hypothetical protein
MGLRGRLTERAVEAIESEARREDEELAREVRKTRESRKYRKLAKHGEVSVPGRATLDLPSGKVKLRYVESVRANQRASDAGGLSFRAPKDLLVRIAPAGGGEAIEVTPRSTLLRPDHLPGAGTYVTVRTAKIPGPGSYEVSVEGGNEGAIEPRVVFG